MESDDKGDLPFVVSFSLLGAFVFSGRREARSVERGHLFFSCLAGLFSWACLFFRREGGTISWLGPGRQTNN